MSIVQGVQLGRTKELVPFVRAAPFWYVVDTERVVNQGIERGN